ncbi:MAG: putative acetyltransferase [Solirubrobacterales bacterium]|jgi:N-hydroxyarylamine O-acetyltransferase|nr:putative acetyltransferase [Solirubrobacterales bacterium]
MFDLDAYLARIGLSGRPSLAEMHRAHTTSIPFENLDPRRGRPVSLTLEDLQEKLVVQRRGGYCFEHNLLFKGALEALGAEVDPLLARVRLGAEPGVTRPRSHLLLGVAIDGRRWHADVGFGMGTPLEPLPFGAGEEHHQSGWRYRVVADGAELVLQTADRDDWVDMYGFLPEPVPMVDVETSNWFTATHPRSPFVSGLSVGAQAADGTRAWLSDWSGLALEVRTPTDRSLTPVALEDVPQLLADRFGLAGFALEPDDRLVPISIR